MSSTGIETVNGGNKYDHQQQSTYQPNHEDSFDTISSTTKPRPAFGVSEKDVTDTTTAAAVHNNDQRRVPDQPARLYWIRPVVLIGVPAIVTAYYAVIWVHLVQNANYDEAVKHRSFSGALIFYSWFMIGIFGLSWSKYGLTGLEAALIRQRGWAPPNLVALLMHSNGSWSGPSGWGKVIMQRQFHRLWCLLAFLSLLPYIAFPLSGLVFEISDGYLKTSDPAMVVGRSRDTFNMRYDEIGNEFGLNEAPANAGWLIAAQPVIPRLGVVYSGEEVDRTEHEDFEKLPNTLPLTESIPDLFLAPQGDKPVNGKAWGLRFQYNCSAVQSASEFTILSQKSTSSASDKNPAYRNDRSFVLTTPSGDRIALWDSSSDAASVGKNTQSYYEVGTTAWEVSLDKVTEKYTGDHPGFEQELVFEYALYQVRVSTINAIDIPEKDNTFNATLSPSIEGLSSGSPFVQLDNGTWTVNKPFFAIKDGNAYDLAEMSLDYFIGPSSAGNMLEQAPPIGIRCVASSDVGFADLNGVTSSFSNFERVGPKHNLSTGSTYFWGALRFGRTAEKILDGQYYQHYLSGDLAGAVPTSSEDTGRYAEYVTPEALLRSVNLAYALDASNLMYDLRSGLNNEWENPNLTITREGKILSAASLVPGVAMGNFVLALFCVWAALSAGLGLVYGFRKRPADKVDGYVMLRKGADMAGELKRNDEFMSGKPFGESETLKGLDGHVLGGKSSRGDLS
ncbi:hypothetical protein B0H66DRAFT_562759 [Apodospora peruviana]|uniref:Uncharacterized protein n=1 Tax=Apodospora peruviana TaxID=516989 RepID=A0AAE0I1X1_9PEZI|nr:hypothetical protein B0H66DRAFT_562759 [Apodospora peruviana]